MEFISIVLKETRLSYDIKLVGISWGFWWQHSMRIKAVMILFSCSAPLFVAAFKSLFPPPPPSLSYPYFPAFWIYYCGQLLTEQEWIYWMILCQSRYYAISSILKAVLVFWKVCSLESDIQWFLFLWKPVGSRLEGWCKCLLDEFKVGIIHVHLNELIIDKLLWGQLLN